MKKLVLFFSVLTLLSFIIPNENVKISYQDNNEKDHKVDQTLQNLYNMTKMNEIALSYHNNGWITFKENLKISPDSIFVNYGKYFGLGIDDKMVLEAVHEDEQGYKHYRFQQYYKGVKVEGMRYNIHSKDNISHSANGKLVANLNINVKPNVSKEKAYLIALKGDSRYLLNNTVIIDKTSTKSPNTEDLLIVRKPEYENFMNSSFILVYNFHAADTIANVSFDIQVDPSKNSIHDIKSKSRQVILPTNPGTCKTLYNGVQNVMTYYDHSTWICDGIYYMSDHSNKYEAYCINYGMCEVFGCTIPYLRDEDNIWDYDEEILETTAFWACQKANEYFDFTHNWKGLDNYNTSILLDPEVSKTYPYAEYTVNADGTPEIIFGCDIDLKCKNMLSLDIVGHEYTHGVIQNCHGGVNNLGETGAIEEGLADIFGNLIQTYVEGYDSTRSYTMGEDVLLQDKYKRSLSNPNSMGEHSWNGDCNMMPGMPDTYLGDFWDPRSCDNCAVHANSTVMSHWFYLLAEGGDGFNDFGYHYHVDGIGRSNAAKIVWKLILDDLFDYYACYADVRAGTTEAAIHQFGLCTNEYYQVINAWNAVGVNDYYVGLDHVAIINSPSTVCESGVTFSINCMPCAGTVVWSKSDNLSWIGSNTGNSVTVCASSPEINGLGSLNVTVYTNMGTYYPSPASFWVGSGLQNPISLSINGENGEFVQYTNDMWELCPNTNYVIRSSYGSGISAWDWSVPASWEILSNENYPEILVHTGDYINWEDEVHVDVYNTGCGNWIYCADNLLVTEPPNGIGCGELLQFNLYPNPATSIVTLQIAETDYLRKNASKVKVSVANKFGTVFIDKVISGNIESIDISNLPNGEYILALSNGRIIKSQSFIKIN